jgi:hypothetical protein
VHNTRSSRVSNLRHKFGSARTTGVGLISINPTPTFLTLEGAFLSTYKVSPMTVYRSLKVFSYVVLGLMLAGIAYASTISVIYWTGISV